MIVHLVKSTGTAMARIRSNSKIIARLKSDKSIIAVEYKAPTTDKINVKLSICKNIRKKENLGSFN